MRYKYDEINIEDLGDECFMKASEIRERKEEIAGELREYIRWNNKGRVADGYYFKKVHLEDLVEWYLAEVHNSVWKPYFDVKGIAVKTADEVREDKYIFRNEGQAELSEFEGDEV